MEFDKTLNEKNKLLIVFIDGYKFDFRKVLNNKM